MSGRSETQVLVRDLRKKGFVVVRTGSGHWKVTRPGVAGCVVMGFSPNKTGKHRTLKRLAQLGYQPGGK